MGWNEKEWKEGKNIHCLRLTITHFTINKITRAICAQNLWLEGNFKLPSCVSVDISNMCTFE
jgi:hypothetical protein